MTLEELITYTEKSLSKSSLCLSELAKAEMKKRYAKSETEGGYSKYWKEISLKDADDTRNLTVDAVTYEGEDRTILWKTK